MIRVTHLSTGSAAAPLALAALLLGVLLALTALTAPPVRAADEAVSITTFQFSPAEVTIQVGDTVTWTNNELDASHTVTSDAGTPAAFDSTGMSPGQSFAFDFAKAGTYAYHCDFHANMTGTVVVAAAAEPTPAASVPNSAAAPGAGLGASLQGWSLGLGLLFMSLGVFALVLQRRRGPA